MLLSLLNVVNDNHKQETTKIKKRNFIKKLFFIIKILDSLLRLGG